MWLIEGILREKKLLREVPVWYQFSASNVTPVDGVVHHEYGMYAQNCFNKVCDNWTNQIVLVVLEEW